MEHGSAGKEEETDFIVNKNCFFLLLLFKTDSGGQWKRILNPKAELEANMQQKFMLLAPEKDILMALDSDRVIDRVAEKREL